MAYHRQRPQVKYGTIERDGVVVPTLVIGDRVAVIVELRQPLDFDLSLNTLFGDQGQVVQAHQNRFMWTQENDAETVCGFRSFGGKPYRFGDATPETLQRIKDLWELQGLQLVLAETIDLERKIDTEMEQRHRRRQQTVRSESWIWS